MIIIIFFFGYFFASALPSKRALQGLGFDVCSIGQTYIEGYGCVGICGGYAGLPCESGEVCTDVEGDGCDLGTEPNCQGICLKSCAAVTCITDCVNGECVEACDPDKDDCSDDDQICVPDPRCSPRKGDCDGVCRDSSSTCGENQIFDECGSACPAECGDLGPKICILPCIRGCRCKDGFVIDPFTGECILPENCLDFDMTTDEPISLPTDFNICGDGEEYKSCGTCDDVCNMDLFCTQVCRPGCYCMKGYKRSSFFGECIPEDECPTEEPISDKCDSDNEEYKSCGTCDSVCGVDIFCTQVCRPGCYCKEGYVRDSYFFGECIPEDSCPTEAPIVTQAIDCGENQIYKDCGTCNQVCGLDLSCAQVCRPGCFCKPGYRLENFFGGDCIPEDECGDDAFGTTEVVIDVTDDDSKDCDENEVYKTCGTSCPKTCDTLGELVACNRMCNRGCFCKSGYVLDDEDGECIPIDECPTEEPVTTEGCGENEEYKTCGTSCPATCDTLGDDVICNFMCNIGCFCKKGYVLDEEDGECIPIDECPTEEPVSTEDPTDCDENEVYKTCGTSCPPTCDTLGDLVACNRMCNRGCFCKEGYVLDEEDGECIPKDECGDDEPDTTEGMDVTMFDMSTTANDPQCPVDGLDELYFLDFDLVEKACKICLYPRGGRRKNKVCKKISALINAISDDWGECLIGACNYGCSLSQLEPAPTADYGDCECDSFQCTLGGDANKHGILIVIGVVGIVFGWM